MCIEYRSFNIDISRGSSLCKYVLEVTSNASIRHNGVSIVYPVLYSCYNVAWN